MFLLLNLEFGDYLEILVKDQADDFKSGKSLLYDDDVNT